MTKSDFLNYLKVIRMLYGITKAQNVLDEYMEQLYDESTTTIKLKIKKV